MNETEQNAKDLRVCATFVFLREQIEAAREREGGYPSDRRGEIAVLREEIQKLLPDLREILERGKT